MAVRAEEIASILREQIESFGSTVTATDVGSVIEAGDGVARIHASSCTHSWSLPTARLWRSTSKGILRRVLVNTPHQEATIPPPPSSRPSAPSSGASRRSRNPSMGRAPSARPHPPSTIAPAYLRKTGPPVQTSIHRRDVPHRRGCASSSSAPLYRKPPLPSTPSQPESTSLYLVAIGQSSKSPSCGILEEAARWTTPLRGRQVLRIPTPDWRLMRLHHGEES